MTRRLPFRQPPGVGQHQKLEPDQITRDPELAILEAVETLRELDTSSVEPTSHAAATAARWREDAVQPSLSVDKALANAPAKVGTSFAVPRILE